MTVSSSYLLRPTSLVLATTHMEYSEKYFGLAAYIQYDLYDLF